jgi:hypothetical protein
MPPMAMEAQKTANAASKTEGTDRARHSVNWPRSSGSGRTWFRLYTDTTAWEMREKRLQMSSSLCSGRTWFRLYTDTTAWEMREKRRLQTSSLFLTLGRAATRTGSLQRFRAHMVQAVQSTRTHGLRNAGEKEGYKGRRCFVPDAHGSGCTRTPRPKKCGRKEGYKAHIGQAN